MSYAQRKQMNARPLFNNVLLNVCAMLYYLYMYIDTKTWQIKRN